MGLILNNPMVQVFLDATPGAREIVVLSCVVSYLDDFDQVVVDLPASGHAVALPKIPDTANRLMRTGLIHERSGEIMAVLRGPIPHLESWHCRKRWSSMRPLSCTKNSSRFCPISVFPLSF